MSHDQQSPRSEAARSAITRGDTSLGIELGSTRIKAVLIGPDHQPLAVGNHDWENQFVDRLWTYSLESVWSGIQGCVAALADDVRDRHGVPLTAVGSIGVSAMMHGYLAFAAEPGASDGTLLTPFRTWRNTNTAAAASRLSALFGHNIPLRWSIAHLHQAVLDGEQHVPDITFLTSLAGYVHWRLTGERVIGVGDASGVFPIDTTTGDYDATMLAAFDGLVADRGFPWRVADLLPRVLTAGDVAGHLTAEGAALLDPSGTLQPGAPLCPPEGDAGTGMVATNSVAPRTGNVSAGTSIFAMVVLEHPLTASHPELDLVTTPSGDLVAMVHCNNGASELNAWAGLFGEFATALGAPADSSTVFETLFHAALRGDADGGGLLAYNFLSGEHNLGLEEGRPLLVRTPDSSLTLANFARTQLFAMLATLRLGMDVLTGEHVATDSLFGHGGLFKTRGVGQRILAGALNTAVSVGDLAAEGGAWGIAVLAAFSRDRAGAADLGHYLGDTVFAGAQLETVAPDQHDVDGFNRFMERFTAGLDIERAAVENS